VLADPSRFAAHGFLEKRSLSPMQFRQEHLIISRLCMEMARWFGQSTYANDERRTEKCEYAQIISALMIGHIEERPFCSSKLATYLDMPRSSVTRKLAMSARRIKKPIFESLAGLLRKRLA